MRPCVSCLVRSPTLPPDQIVHVSFFSNSCFSELQQIQNCSRVSWNVVGAGLFETNFDIFKVGQNNFPIYRSYCHYSNFMVTPTTGPRTSLIVYLYDFWHLSRDAFVPIYSSLVRPPALTNVCCPQSISGNEHLAFGATSKSGNDTQPRL